MCNLVVSGSCQGGKKPTADSGQADGWQSLSLPTRPSAQLSRVGLHGISAHTKRLPGKADRLTKRTSDCDVVPATTLACSEADVDEGKTRHGSPEQITAASARFQTLTVYDKTAAHARTNGGRFYYDVRHLASTSHTHTHTQTHTHTRSHRHLL